MPKPVTKLTILEKIKNKIPELLISLGIFCIAISVFYWQGRWRALALDRQLLAQYQPPAIISRPSPPQHLEIKWFVDVEIETHIIENDRWTIAESVASYLDQSARPGESGNIIIYGHNTRPILGNIRALKGGEEIKLTTADGQIHTYQITGLHQVDPDQTQFLQPATEEVLTIYTCAGWMDRQRFIVQARPKTISQPQNQ